eukprot:CAMPEP_0201594276 /NCGR_PEP_ID=MMETSP0190_2-20130828/191639_1 /ASSEMBLY_ACC=CAM_ASM_000263 /TAXON_ID=37353 /ORGANISM="Rosalina sp." /LENGTH=308 /DNA_ID=CAMNT_0048053821 /DNA_START=90 /DNA_END=1013 /DNA_ORIENTATION=+
MASDVPMNGDGQPKMPKMKPQTSSGSTGSGATMGGTTAMQNRLAQLQAMQQRKGRGGKKSFDASQSLTRGTSNANRDRYYSLANTKSDLKKIDNQRAQQRKEKQALKNRTMKKYIQSKKNVLAGVDMNDDDSKMNEDGDAAMLINDKDFSKVDDDGDTELNQTPLSPAPKEYNGNQTDTEMKEEEPPSKPKSQPVDTKMKQKDKSSANSQQTIKPKANASPVRTPIANPSVNLSEGKGGNASSQTGGKGGKRSSGIFGGLFKKNKNGDANAPSGGNGYGANDGTVVEPKRLKYQLPNSKGEKFELYTW